MASVKYSIQSKSINSAIYLRLSVNRNINTKRKTGLSINAKDWSVKTGLPKQNDPSNKNLHSKLIKLEAFIYEQLNNSSIKGEEINGNWLASKIDLHFGRTELIELDRLVYYGRNMIAGLDYRVTDKGKKGVSVSTKKKYQTIVNKLEKFQEFKGRILYVKDVDLDFRSEFIKYLSEIHKLSDNTIGRYLNVVKTICLDANRNGIKINPQLSHFL